MKEARPEVSALRAARAVAPDFGRRQVLSLGAAVALGRALAACAALDGSDRSSACTLTPEQENGPFYVDLGLVRSDVREKQAGIPLQLEITVRDATTCRPITDAAVDIWSASAVGVYSAEASEKTVGQTYLRGVQITDRDGRVRFTTIYPGWYSDRANHVHVKVHLGGIESDGTYEDGTTGYVCHTGQMFFDPADNDAVKQVAPYSSNRNKFVTNAKDGVYLHQHGDESVVALSGSPATGYVATIVLFVESGATSS